MKHLLLIGNIDGKSVPLLRYASRICADFNLKLHVLSVEQSSEAILLSSENHFNKQNLYINHLLDKQKSRETENFVKDSTKDLIMSDWISHKLLKGNVQDCVEKFINEEKIDLLIIRQLTLRKNKFIGNELFSKIFMNISDLPMLVIPENQIYVTPQKMAYFTTFSEFDFENIKWLTQNLTNLEIELIHFSAEEISVKNEKWFKYLKSEFKNNKISLDYRNEEIGAFINREAASNAVNYDCLALSTQKRNFWERLIDPSTTLELISDIETPIFIFKHK